MITRLHTRNLACGLHCLAVAALLSTTITALRVSAQELVPPKPTNSIRVATYNVSLNRKSEGQLAKELIQSDPQAEAVAAVIRTVKPDILLLNELDFSPETNNATLFVENYLAKPAVDSLGNQAWPLPNIFAGPVNTGVPSKLDLNANGRTDDAEDAWGYGTFPGQYGMAVVSRFEIVSNDIVTLQEFRWSEFPNALRPKFPDSGDNYYDDPTWKSLRLSSKSFFDVPILTPLGQLHVLASHPTPPAFDGTEDRNGCRNHDEIRLIEEYIRSNPALRDDNGLRAGLTETDRFVVLGDLNSDPLDGGSRSEAIQNLLSNPRINAALTPASEGARVASEQQAKANKTQLGPPETDTADFNDRSVGNLRVDYALPSEQFEVIQSGVFWPDLNSAPEQLRDALKQSMNASDHHLVWIDIRLK